MEWTSQRGGSVVLTQALTTLAAKGVTLNEQNHIVKMCWATSDPKQTLSATIGNAQRAADKTDPYNWDDYGRELANGTMTVNTVIGIGALCGGLATGSPLLATVGTITGGVGALQFAYKTMKERIGRG